MSNGPVQVVIVKKTCECDNCYRAWTQIDKHNESIDFAATQR